MLRVREVAGPTTARIGELVNYLVTAFNEPAPDPAEAADVNWLVKSADGSALTHLSQIGPALEVAIPQTWANQTAIVMPYMKSPSAAISVRTRIESLPPGPPLGTRQVEVIREGERFYAAVDGEPRFYLGTRVRYGERRGLMNSSNPPGPRYLPDDYEATYGQWAWYLLPTILCESRAHYTCLNTYDRAAFTFGHIQLAAHTPDDNFVVFLRELLQLPSAPEYFPDLTLTNGRIHRVTGAGTSPLETAASTTGLMQYFNPTSDEVDADEAERAGRMVDWCLRYPQIRDRQVDFSVREQRRKLTIHARKLPQLDGLVDKLCLVVMDILHQGRGKYVTIATALGANDPFDALLAIGATNHGPRIATLRAGIRDLEQQGRVGQKVYDATVEDFVLPGEV